jgi:LmbE family N-acetylglucosaminyl deacetylase
LFKDRMSNRWRLFARCLALLLLTGCGSSGRALDPAGVDLLVFGPHPDDESLGCGGVLAEAWRSGRRARVVLLTNGDAHRVAASLMAGKPEPSLTPDDYQAVSRARLTHGRQAIVALGGKAEDLVLLGYPDSLLDRLFQHADPVSSPTTLRNETYGLIQPDYHTAVHGSAAPYTKASLMGDVTELLRTLSPREVYVTHEADSHPDHKAAFRIVREAVRTSGVPAKIHAYLVHGGPGDSWPWPRGRTARFESREVGGKRIPAGLPWPPPHRVPLSPEATRAKGAALERHLAFLGVEAPAARRDYFESFVKSEEIFWPVTDP